MSFNKLASTILRGTFLLETRTAAGMFPIAERYLAREKVAFWDDEDEDEEDDTLTAYLITAEGERLALHAQVNGQSTNIFQDAPAGSIAVIPIEGVIMKDDFCGSPGTATMSQWLLDARDAENIIGSILYVNSGGGSVEGTAEFADVIKEVAQDMPVEVYTDGLVASAAYWLSSGATRITASSKTVEIGSIGTMARYTDYSKYYAEMGINKVDVYADKSFDKHAYQKEAIAGDPTRLQENILNPTNEIFLTAVKENRGEKLQLTEVKNEETGVTGEEPLTGKTYLAEKAIELGLIDAIGKFEQVYSSVLTSAGAGNLIANHKNKDMSLFGSKFKKLNAVKSKKAEEISEAEILAINEELTEEGFGNVAVISKTQLEEADANADAIENGLTALNAALTPKKLYTNMEEAITALVAERDAEHKRAEEYGDQPGEKPTKVKTEVTQEGPALREEKDGPEKYQTSGDRELAELDKQTKK